MRALVLSAFGADPTVAEVPDPEPGPGEVLVRVHAASLNGFDLAVAAGYLQGMMEYRFPVVIGKDFAGTVEAVGPGVDGFAPGDEVFGVVTKPVLQDGSIAELVTVPTTIGLAGRPPQLGIEPAAGLGLAGSAALQSVAGTSVGAGDTVLVSGATGGVGSFAVQLAAARGARVIATARPGDGAAFVEELGADVVVDYTGDLVAQVREAAPDGVDVALHFAGDGATLASLVRDGGRLASALGFSLDDDAGRGITSYPLMATPDPATLLALAALVVEGGLRVPIQRTYELVDATAALRDFTGGTRGKLIVAIA